MHFSRFVSVFLTIVCSGTWITNSEEIDPYVRLRVALENFDLYYVMEKTVKDLGNFIVKSASQYQQFFQATFMTGKLEAKPLTKEGCDLKVSVENAHFIFKFLVNETAKEALARISKCNATFLNGDDRDVICVGVNLQHIDDGKRLMCAWVANSYSANGTLNKSLPLESVDTVLHWKNTTTKLKFAHNTSTVMRREPVRDYYDILEEVGEGKRTKVYKCVEKSSGNIFAARIINVFAIYEKEMLYEEVDIMNELSHPTSHPNLLTLHEVFDNDEEFVMIVDFLEKDLGSHRQECLDAPTGVNYYVRQICEGLKHMHAKNIVHMNIQPSNVMLEKNVVEVIGLVKETEHEILNDPDAQRRRLVKIIDFGAAQKTDNIRVQSVPTHLGVHYHDLNTPESLENRPLGSYTDMWHVGVLTFYLETGDYPQWGPWGANCSETDEHIKQGRWSTFFKRDTKNLPEIVLHFIGHLLVPDIKKRMTANECLNHPWITGKHITQGPAQNDQ